MGRNVMSGSAVPNRQVRVVVVSAMERGLSSLLAKYCGGQASGVDHIHILGMGLERACN